jgi:hypothetical protein
MAARPNRKIGLSNDTGNLQFTIYDWEFVVHKALLRCTVELLHVVLQLNEVPEITEIAVSHGAAE